MPAAEDQQPVEALSTEAPDPALGVRSRPRRSDGRLDHADAFGAEDLVEVAAELAVAVTDQEPRLDALVVEVHEQVARLRSEEHTSELQSRENLVCRLLL